MNTYAGYFLMLMGIAAALVAAGCGGDGDDMSADLRRQLDMEEAARMMAEGELAVLRAQIETLMGRADISPDDLTALRTQIETLMGRADISPDDLAALQAQLDTLMDRADISPDDLTALQAQVETLMGRADISPDDLAALQVQLMSAQGQLEGAKEAAIAERIGNTASWYDTSIAANSHLEPGGETAWVRAAQSLSSGSGYAVMTQSYKDGGFVFNASAWNGEDGQIEFHVGINPFWYPLQRNPTVEAGRLIYTSDRNQAEHGVTTSHGTLESPGLEPWRGFEATKAYDGGGTLSVRYFTDLEESGNVGAPYLKDDDSIQRFQQRGIVLNDPPVPTLPANWDTLVVNVPDDGLAGFLGGAAGRFSCAPGTNCFLVSDRPVEPRYPFPSYIPLGTVVFTADDGSGPEELAPVSNGQVPVANYLSFGSWLYVPPDVTDANAFEFGVFAGGDDPFTLDNLVGLAGTADYAGAAAGMYAESLPEGETVGTFSAKVELKADFGTTGDFGSIGGKVYEFQLDSGKTPPLTEVMLLTQSWRDSAGTRNIFLSPFPELPPVPGGWIYSNTRAEGTDGRVWDGIWTGKFLGNGSTAEEHPGSFAETFGVRDLATDSFTLAGSFGTHRQ